MDSGNSYSKKVNDHFYFFRGCTFKNSKTTDMDTLFRRESSNADPNCRKMGHSQRRVEEGGFEGGGVGGINSFLRVCRQMISINPRTKE
jgi:hypothetical protein